MIDKNSTFAASQLVAKLERVTGAFLGSAVGDALGWPFEGHADHPINKDRWKGDFFSWNKKSGSRFRPTIEYISAGEYSDDTQLLLAIARSRKETNEWWTDFAFCELPFWTVYERGGGGATKRAASCWLTGTAPWLSDNESSSKYFSAGGNGVAMRILPHCILGLAEPTFEKVALDIITDGVITHGHPRAIIGALAYGFALWYVLQLNGTLKFGEIIDVTIDNSKTWGRLLSIEDRWPKWEQSARNSLNYQGVWIETVDEMLQLLNSVKSSVQAGALSLDEEALNSIRAIKSKASGAGTICAAAAIYFASRYAADPLEGVRRAASAIGADTDTIASMSGALLGALTGKSWLRPLIPNLQDHTYIENIAQSFVFNEMRNNVPRPAIRKNDLTRLSKLISDGEINSKLERLPNLMAIESVRMDINDDRSASKKTVLRYKVFTSEGLTFHFKESTAAAKTKIEASLFDKQKSFSAEPRESHNIIGISLAVSSLEASRVFYENMLGLEISGETPKTIRFGTVLALKEEHIDPLITRSVTIFLQVNNLEKLRRKMIEFGYPLLSEIVEKSQRRSFECTDPDGYNVEIVEHRKT